MPKRIILCPIGFVEGDVLDRIARSIERRCGVAGIISAGMENPAYAYDRGRGQYNSKLILKHLSECCPDDGLMFMGITHVDLFVPILKYVFGLAEIKGRCAVISTHRLRPEYYGESPDPPIFLARMEKTALHELGHCFGLTHCRDRRCVMYSSTHIEHTDLKKPDFCPTCLELFKWYLEKSAIPRQLKADSS
ncbi:MAG: archaemetzincin family Zn-dependent metalloprotease [Deltaproteobacteria bacterium]|nr:archaemetzincin family Zn-dependent metalloprotease [Deltaproteobacteria bacterium]MBW1817671.1 archaemetzincin family Zn-dependent metalloprotease [Deltaproteobacteria bacterium]